VHPDLDRLVRAQEIDRHLTETRGRLERFVPRRKAAEDGVAAARQALAQAEERAKAVALARRTAEKDVETLGEQERRFQTQLTQVKKNDEYTALLHEIEGAKKKRSERETAVLETMDEEGRAAAAIVAAKAALAVAEKRAASERATNAEAEGVGRQLFEHAEGYAISEGASSLQVVVSSGDRRALDFYLGRGFVRAGEDLLELILPRR